MQVAREVRMEHFCAKAWRAEKRLRHGVTGFKKPEDFIFDPESHWEAPKDKRHVLGSFEL